jgi:hypothetical protein
MNKSKSLQQMIDAIKVHSNFCKEHPKFKKTASEQVCIKFEIQNNRIKTLFKSS